MRYLHLSLILILVVLESLGRAQSPKPPVPFGGLSITLSSSSTITYGDGYITRGHLTHPSVAPPTTGWPLVIRAHGLGGSRFDLTWNNLIAAQGFAVWSYDVRGHGEAIGLNPSTVGFTGLGAVEKADLAEQISFARTQFPALVHPSKVAVVAASDPQSSWHCWAAAAHSGQTIVVPGRPPIAFPIISAIAVDHGAPELLESLLPNGEHFSATYTNLAFAPFALFPVVWDQGFRNLVQFAWVTQDAPLAYGALASEPHRLNFPSLASSAVPIWAWAELLIENFDELPTYEFMLSNSAGPRRLFVGEWSAPGGYLARELELFLNERIRWLDRYLWDVQNGVELEPKLSWSVLPVDPVAYGNSQISMPKRQESVLPPYDVFAERRYLHGTGALAPSQNSGGGQSVITHTVPATYDPIAYLQDSAVPSVLATVPMSELVFTTAPLGTESELAGTPSLSLRLTPDGPDGFVAASLKVRLPGSASDFELSSTGRRLRNLIPNQAIQVQLDLPPVSALLPPGTTIKLLLRNHWLVEAPSAVAFRATPLFLNFSLAVHHGTGIDASFLDLPFRAARRPTLTGPYLQMPIAAPFDYPMTLDGGLARAGHSYIMGLSLSGQGPGIATSTPGLIIPLAYDSSTAFALSNLEDSLLVNFVGTLNGFGFATPMCAAAGLAPFLTPALAPLRASFAAYLVSPSQTAPAASNAIDVTLR